ncbi:hypothetical protein QR680_000339 [Steinernema hermaphroditum]|uniref:Uncharacterized protein n=1 Tax=Steinernema hermaphroditum TaxID=289476 RepID=A0AA39GV01_9BILA|nr:hypothetical protein QR680_000339 [Steinernema hermaphroditum]
MIVACRRLRRILHLCGRSSSRPYYVALCMLLFTLSSHVDWKEIFAAEDPEVDITTHLNHLDLLDPQKIAVRENISSNDLIVVTAFSYNHAKEARLFCEHFNTHPELSKWTGSWRLILYNLGDVSPYMIERMRRQCPKAEFRDFDFSPYPRYVRRLKEYRWKHLLIAEMLKESPLVFYGDTSARVLNYKSQTPMQDIIDEILQPNRIGVSLYTETTSSIFQATNPLMFPFFTYNVSMAKDVTMCNASPALWIGTNEVKTYILREMVKCSLERDCMAPPGSQIPCSSNEDSGIYSNCHRYDQSALNIVLSQVSNYQSYLYISGTQNVAVRRGIH